MSKLPPLPAEPAAPAAAPLAGNQPKVSDAEMDQLFADLGVARGSGAHGVRAPKSRLEKAG